MLYIIGTRICTRQTDDPRIPKNKQKRVASWLPVDLEWVLGRISVTKDADSVDYMFYCELNPQRTHTTTFPDCTTADAAIAAARGETIVDTPTPSRDEIDIDDKFSQINDQLNRKQRIADQRKGGRPGNLGNRMGR
jgi:hypothetical protein|tara:strand:- start:3686 stop:4093 length:408 start_codon:yes stop_codon:yes gene_type:complete